MFKEITVQRISAGSLYKLAAVGMAFTIVPFAMLMGCFALFGASTVSWNKQPLTGFAGLVASPAIGLFVSIVFAALLGTGLAVGLWLYSRWRPLTIRVKVLGGEADSTD